MKTTETKKKIEFGDKDLLSDEDFKHCKVRISMMVDEEVLNAFRQKAAENHEPYQVLMQRALRESLQKPTVEERLARLESKVFKAS